MSIVDGPSWEKENAFWIAKYQEETELAGLARERLNVAAPRMLNALIGLIEECNAFAKVIPPYANSEALKEAKDAVRQAQGEQA